MIISIGKLGKIELAPNTTLALSFTEKGISGDLTAGSVTVLSAADSVIINTVGGNTVTLNSGETASANNAQKKDDTTSDSGGGHAGLIWAVILVAAGAGIVLAATTNNNNTQLGGTSTVVSPSR